MPITNAEYHRQWRINHPEAYSAKQKRYYEKYPEKTKARVMRGRMYKSEVKRLMNILIE